MKTFKTIEDYEKYMNDFVDTFHANENFMIENGVTMVLSTSTNEKGPSKQVIFGEPTLVGANLSSIIHKLPSDLAKAMYKVLKKIK